MGSREFYYTFFCIVLKGYCFWNWQIQAQFQKKAMPSNVAQFITNNDATYKAVGEKPPKRD